MIDAGDGPVLLLLHAFPCDSRMWQPQARAAADAGWRALALDLPGFAGSALPQGEPSMEAVAASVLGELEGRDVSRVVVAGVSLGGYVAMELVRQRPSMIAGLVLCDTKATADSQEARDNRERLARMVDEAPGDCGRILEQAVLPGLLGGTTRAERPDTVALVRGWLNEAPAATVAWYQRAMGRRPDSLRDLADLGAPTLLVWGEEDALSPRSEQEAMLQSLGDARLVVVPRAGHLANVEDPDAVSRPLVEYLRVVRGPRHA